LSPHAPGFLLLRHGIGIGIGIAALAWHGVATTPLGLEPVSASWFSNLCLKKVADHHVKHAQCKAAARGSSAAAPARGACEELVSRSHVPCSAYPVVRSVHFGIMSPVCFERIMLVLKDAFAWEFIAFLDEARVNACAKEKEGLELAQRYMLRVTSPTLRCWKCNVLLVFFHDKLFYLNLTEFIKKQHIIMYIYVRCWYNFLYIELI
jgi:hypothetical protein